MVEGEQRAAEHIRTAPTIDFSITFAQDDFDVNEPFEQVGDLSCRQRFTDDEPAVLCVPLFAFDAMIVARFRVTHLGYLRGPLTEPSGTFIQDTGPYTGDAACHVRHDDESQPDTRAHLRPSRLS